jgi:hypothetical protein
MLIKFFRSSYIIQYFFLLVITAALWIPGFMAGQGLPVGTSLITPLYNPVHYVLSLLDAASPAFALAMVLLAAFTLNNILIYHELTPKNNLLPAFLFILLMSSNPHTLCSYPVSIALLLFTWFLHTIYKMNDEPENYMEVFNASMLVAVISMIYPAALILFIFIWLALLVYGTFNGRNLIISFIALVLPYLYLFLYYFWTDQSGEALSAYLLYLKNIMNFVTNRNVVQLILWGLFVVLMLFPAFTRLTGNLGSFGINFRKKMGATAWLLAFCIPMIIMDGRVDYHTLVFLPAGIMIAHYYHQFKKSVMNEIILLVFLFLALLNNYLPLLNAEVILNR